MVIHLLDCYGKGSSKKSYQDTGGKKFPNCECLFVHRDLSVYVDDIKLVGKKQYLSDVESTAQTC